MMTQGVMASVGGHVLAVGFILAAIGIMALGAAAPTPGTGATLYVSKLGDNSELLHYLGENCPDF